MSKKKPKRLKIEDGSNAFDSLKRDLVYSSLNDELDVVQNPNFNYGPESSGAPRYFLGMGYHKAALARSIENFLKNVEREPGVPFEFIRSHNKRPVLQVNALGEWFGTVMRCAVWDDTRHEFSEEVQLVLQGVRALDIDPFQLKHADSRDLSNGRFGYQHFNNLVAWLRTALVEEGFTARRRRRREQARRHFLSGKTYIDQLFDRYARLIVLRIDLGYVAWPNRANGVGPFDEDFAESVSEADADSETKVEKKIPPGKSLTKARSDLARFLNNRRSNGIFDHMVGHMWKLEEGETKGYHFHLMAFFDGSRVQQDAHLAKQLGDYWQNAITKGEGVYYNCNGHKSVYRKLGIGRINHDDGQLRENLLLALAYMTKADQYLRVRTDAARIFGKGVVKPRVSAAGRPRKLGSEDDTPTDAGDEQAPDDEDRKGETS